MIAGIAGGTAPASASMADGFRVLRARPGQARLTGETGSATDIWGYDGASPGPLLRVRRGEELKVRLVNELTEPTAIHWHGLRVPSVTNGLEHLSDAVATPGASFDYRFRVPDAGTFWYHAPYSTPNQLARGLSGVVLVDEPQPVDVDQDIVLLLQDWPLTAGGVLAEPSDMGNTRHHVTVNGASGQDIRVKTNQRLRLRFINASARILGIRIDGHQAMVMAIDGQPAEPFVAREGSAALAPGGRIDFFVDATLAAGATSPITLATGTALQPIARLVYDRGPSARTQPRVDPAPLPPNPLPGRMDFIGALKLEVPLDKASNRNALRVPGARDGPPPGAGGPQAPIWLTHAQSARGDFGRLLFSVRRGRTAMLAFVNKSTAPQALHLHGHPFRLLDAMDDGWKPFWLDTAIAMPGRTLRIAFIAETLGRWPIYWHASAPGEGGVMTWYEAT